MSNNLKSNMATSSSTEQNVLVLILDACGDFANSTTSTDPSQILTFNQCTDHVITFLNSYLIMKGSNAVSVCLCHQAGSDIVYPVKDKCSLDDTDNEFKSGKYEPLANMNGLLRQEIKRVIYNIASSPPDKVASSTMFSGGLSKALCYIQRCIRECAVGVKIKPRILVVKACPDMPKQHISFMNCIFAAQKQNTPIDSCILWHSSSFLQQAADITGGIHVTVPEPASLLQLLLWVFLPDVSARDSLLLPRAMTIDFRATCFCHQNLLEYGFVCSVCLAIFCNFTPICAVCQTQFKLPSLPILKPKKKKNKQKSK